MTGAPDGSSPRSGHESDDALPVDDEAARRAHEVTRRAIRRLDILEWVIVLTGAGLAAGAGWVMAWMAAGMAGWDFRSTWIGASLFLFVVGGAATIIQIRRDERADAHRAEERREDDG